MKMIGYELWGWWVKITLIHLELLSREIDWLEIWWRYPKFAYDLKTISKLLPWWEKTVAEMRLLCRSGIALWVTNWSIATQGPVSVVSETINWNNSTLSNYLKLNTRNICHFINLSQLFLIHFYWSPTSVCFSSFSLIHSINIFSKSNFKLNHLRLITAIGYPMLYKLLN